MDNTTSNEEISLSDIFHLFKKNTRFIVMSLIMGLIIGLVFSVLSALMNPTDYRYRAKSTLILTDAEGMLNQPQTFLHLIESKSMLTTVTQNLKITDSDFLVSTQPNSKTDHYDIIVEGENNENVVKIADELVSNAIALTTQSLMMDKKNVTEKGHIYGDPIVTVKPVNWKLNIAIGLVLGGIAGVFILFLVRYNSGRIYSPDEAENILGSKVMLRLPGTNKKNGIKEYFQVR